MSLKFDVCCKFDRTVRWREQSISGPTDRVQTDHGYFIVFFFPREDRHAKPFLLKELSETSHPSPPKRMRAIPHPVEIGLGFPYLFLLISAFVRREGISLPKTGTEILNKVLPRQFHLTTPAPALNYSAIDKPIQPNDTHYPPLQALSHGLQAFILFSNSTAAEV